MLSFHERVVTRKGDRRAGWRRRATANQCGGRGLEARGDCGVRGRHVGCRERGGGGASDGGAASSPAPLDTGASGDGPTYGYDPRWNDPGAGDGGTGLSGGLGFGPPAIRPLACHGGGSFFAGGHGDSHGSGSPMGHYGEPTAQLTNQRRMETILANQHVAG